MFLERSPPALSRIGISKAAIRAAAAPELPEPVSLPLQHFLPLAGWFRVLGNWWKYGLHLTSKVLHLEEKKTKNKIKHQMSEERGR